MKRTLEQWQGCNPATMMEGMSKRGVIRTLEEAKADILELHAEVEQLQSASTAFNAVLDYVLDPFTDESDVFMKLWREGAFETCRREWPDAPADCYEGLE